MFSINRLGKTLLTFQLFLLPVSQSYSAIVEYKLAIDGDDSKDHFLPAAGGYFLDSITNNWDVYGVYNLEVWAKVTDNELVANVPGGLLQSAFNLSDTANSIRWGNADGSFLGGPDDRWDSTAHPAFDTHFQGIHQDSATDILAETGAIAPGDFVAQFQDIGADVWSLVASGYFAYDGDPTTLSLTVANPYGGDILVAGLQGLTVVGVFPELVVVDSLRINIPEPHTLFLFMSGLLTTFILPSRLRRLVDT